MNGPINIYLPSANTSQINNYIITDESGTASENNISIYPFENESISGQFIDPAIINVDYGTFWIYSVPNSIFNFVLFTRP
jgi:hypothetical protein